MCVFVCACVCSSSNGSRVNLDEYIPDLKTISASLDLRSKKSTWSCINLGFTRPLTCQNIMHQTCTVPPCGLEVESQVCAKVSAFASSV